MHDERLDRPWDSSRQRELRQAEDDVSHGVDLPRRVVPVEGEVTKGFGMGGGAEEPAEVAGFKVTGREEGEALQLECRRGDAFEGGGVDVDVAEGEVLELR